MLTTLTGLPQGSHPGHPKVPGHGREPLSHHRRCARSAWRDAGFGPQHTLQFLSMPFVLLFSRRCPRMRCIIGCVVFLRRLRRIWVAPQGAIFDDQRPDIILGEQEALRYYVNIIALGSKPVPEGDCLPDVPIDVIAPSHGLIWRGQPQHIVTISTRSGPNAEASAGDPAVTLLYGTMYGLTELMVEALPVAWRRSACRWRSSTSDTHSHILSISTRVLGCWSARRPTRGNVPADGHVAHGGAQRIFNRQAAYFGSRGSGGGVGATLRRSVKPCAGTLPTCGVQGRPTPELRARGLPGARFAQAVLAAAP